MSERLDTRCKELEEVPAAMDALYPTGYLRTATGRVAAGSEWFWSPVSHGHLYKVRRANRDHYGPMGRLVTFPTFKLAARRARKLNRSETDAC